MDLWGLCQRRNTLTTALAKGDPMRYICIMLGYLTGKTKVKCIECKNFVDGKCYGHEMPKDMINKEIACGFWKQK